MVDVTVGETEVPVGGDDIAVGNEVEVVASAEVVVSAAGFAACGARSNSGWGVEVVAGRDIAASPPKDSALCHLIPVGEASPVNEPSASFECQPTAVGL